MTEIVGARNFIQQEETQFEAGVSEGALTRMGAANNYIMRRIYNIEAFAFNGYFNPNNYDDGVSGIRYIEKESTIISYYMSVRYTGDSGNNHFNAAVYDSSNVFINNLFATTTGRLLLSGNSQTNVVVGKKDIDTTPVNIDVNVSGTTTVQYGTLNFVTLPAGAIIIPFIEGNGEAARNMFFNMRLGEI